MHTVFPSCASDNLVMTGSLNLVPGFYPALPDEIGNEVDKSDTWLQSVSWSLAEFRHNKIVQSPHENYFNVCRQHKEK